MKYILLIGLLTANLPLFGMNPGLSAIELLSVGSQSSESSVTTDVEKQRRAEFLKKVATVDEALVLDSSIPQEWIDEALIVLSWKFNNQYTLLKSLLTRANPHYKDDAAFIYLACNLKFTALKMMMDKWGVVRYSTYKKIMEYYRNICALSRYDKDMLGNFCIVLELLERPILPNTYAMVIEHIVHVNCSSQANVNINTVIAHVMSDISAADTMVYGQLRDLVLAEVNPELANYYRGGKDKRD